MNGRGLVLCADDYAIAPGVSAAILELAEAGRLTAISCMTVSPLWPEHARDLRTLAGRIDIGLHLTLTDQAPLGPMERTAPGGRLPALGRLLALGLAGRLDAGEIAAETARQIAAFEAALDHPPDFVDGHQHAHVLPGVRGVVLDAAAELSARWPIWVRSCEERPGTILRRGVATTKALVIAGLSTGMKRAVTRRRLAANAGFGGVLDYRRGPSLRAAMPPFLRQLGPRPLVMCHPGRPDATLAGLDPLVAPRADELAYLASAAFADDLARAGVSLARFAELP